MAVILLSPTNGRPLRRRKDGLLDDGERLWPVVEGIPYLRPKEDLREQVVSSLRAGDRRAALRLLLADQDRFSPTVPPSSAALDQVLDQRTSLTLRQAMELLHFGAVGDYFAYRWCSPTFVSGLRLLELAVPGQGSPVVEYACGIGHYLRELERVGVRATGVDVVFAKLWLARTFMGVRGTLVCGDIEAGPVVAPDRPRTVLCQDAFYFFEHKPAALTHMREVATTTGNVAVGHVHTTLDQHEAGFSSSVDDYRALAGGAVWDDSSLATSWYSGAPPNPAEDSSATVAWVEGRIPAPTQRLCFSSQGARLVLNPLLSSAGVDWPSAGWRTEYTGDATSLGTHTLSELCSRQDVRALVADPTRVHQLDDVAREELYRQRVLINLPARW
ncbi:hypothetical protein LEM8419_01595 [Neolewinella maritima]|uniref:Methyltransferase domain-containing protein n=1 Tax=Neolewinella maritima TaxID=1383882 RepID=A0ABN8F663_9BACT|nr:class I SAM-dependent methyltransferase [Neolewinella maritima]CAH1000442.1 hypothetical protein LEM8419_01595 [Neolewinella maritima]